MVWLASHAARETRSRDGTNISSDGPPALVRADGRSPSHKPNALRTVGRTLCGPCSWRTGGVRRRAGRDPLPFPRGHKGHDVVAACVRYRSRSDGLARMAGLLMTSFVVKRSSGRERLQHKSRRPLGLDLVAAAIESRALRRGIAAAQCAAVAHRGSHPHGPVGRSPVTHRSCAFAQSTRPLSPASGPERPDW